MNITEVRIKMVNDETERLRAFASVTLDGAFVVRDLKVIDGSNGPFVAMPSRKLADRCPKCGNKNHLRARFCNECGAKLNEHRAPRDAQGRVKLHADVAHPINAECREDLQRAVIEAYQEEMELSKEPGYRPADDDYIVDEGDAVETTGYDDFIADLKESISQRRGPDERRPPPDRRPPQHADKPSRSQERAAERPARHSREPRPHSARQIEPRPVLEDPSFAEGLEPVRDEKPAIRPPPPPKPVIPQPEPRRPAPVAPPAADQDTFGAGIL